MIKKELLQLFATPLLITKYEGNIDKELKFIEKLKYEPNGINGNFRSSNSYVFEKKQLKKIKNFCQQSIDMFTKNVWLSTTKLIITQSWCNKNPKGSIHHEHMHPNSILSGVMYFRLDKHLPPIMFSKTQFESLKISFEKYNSLNSQTFYLPAVAGELILFPSHLKHSVPINTSTDERISLSFNTFSKDVLGSEKDLTELNWSKLHASK